MHSLTLTWQPAPDHALEQLHWLWPMHTPPFSHAEPCPAHKQANEKIRHHSEGRRLEVQAGGAEGLRTVEGGHLGVVPGGLADVVAAVLP